MSQTFCPLPWMFQAVRNNGDFRLCCQANVSETRGLLQDDKGHNLNAGVDHPEAARNHALMNEARRLMLAGQWPKSCSRCRHEEASGLRSRRLYENQLWGETVTPRSAAQTTNPDGSLVAGKNPILSYDLRFGNKCNLKCRMCGPADSDFWYDDHVAMSGPSFLDTQGEVLLQKDERGHWLARDPGYTWYEQGEGFWTEMEKGWPQLRHLHIVGGEPLLLQKHYQLLEKLVESGHSSHITLEYNTNLTVLPDRVLALWRQFEKVRIGVSLDGVGAVNEYIRFPSRWTVIERNLQKLDTAPGPLDVWLSLTVQIYNIFHLPEVLKWKLQAGFQKLNAFKRLPIITSHPLHKPLHLNIQALPPHLKRQVDLRFQRAKEELKDLVPRVSHPVVGADALLQSAHSILDGYQRFMHQSDLSQHFPDFLNYTADLDRLREQKWASICPEFLSRVEADDHAVR